MNIAEPEVRVWTNVGPAHLEFFGTVEAIAEAKAEILEGADKDALLVANADDDLVMRHAPRFAGRVRTFGVERPADVRALAVRDLGIDGTAALVRTPIGEAETPDAAAGNRESLQRPCGGGRGDPLRRAAWRHRRACGGAQTCRPARRDHPYGRLTIVDDSYNSNPKALSRALVDDGGRDAVRPARGRHRRNARARRCVGRSASRVGRGSRARRHQRADCRRRIQRARAGRRRDERRHGGGDMCTMWPTARRRPISR